MRAAVLLIALSAAQAGVVSRDWENGKLTLRLDDGVAEVEWLSGTSFRFSHRAASLPPINHDPVAVEFEDTRSTITMRGRYITIGIDKATAGLRVSANSQTIATLAFAGDALHVSPLGKTYGLAGPGDAQRFFFTSGFGMLVRAPLQCVFDLDRGVIHAPAMDLIFYYGSTAKEIFEQHRKVTGKPGVTALPGTPIDSWDALSQLVRTLNQWSLSAVLYPKWNAATNVAPGEIAKRLNDLLAALPIVYDRSSATPWTPYWDTYFREAYDRGYPLIRPFPFEFSRDKTLDPQPDVFMLGDEVLLAPVVAPGVRRRLQLPRGMWTDLRTNAEYPGEQAIEVDAPAGQVPTFARNGSILPLAAKNAMELHYFPDLGGEFFLWEASLKENSQFHAAPAGDFTRVEIESKVERTYEWVIHHTNRPVVVEGCKPVRQRSSLKPGTWWHDGARNDLHVMVRAAAGADNIVNISYVR
jgi:hypothetical protein